MVVSPVGYDINRLRGAMEVAAPTPPRNRLDVS